MSKWHGGASDSGGAAKGTLFPVIFDGEGNRVCNVDSWPEANAEGNYERILLCVNAHDALVAALEMTRDALLLTAAEFAEKHGTKKTKPGALIDPYEKDAMALNKADAALAAAKGEA